MTDPDNAPSLAIATEAFRLQALRELRVLDTAPEEAFDDLAKLAAVICQVPIALVSLVDADRQWFKARCGLDARQTPRGVAFCAHAIQQPLLFELPDATLDPRFADNPLVTDEPHIRFYAGVPLSGLQGYRYGTLCVMDVKPRLLTDEQRDGLTRLARRTTDALETRRMLQRAQSRESTLAQLLEAMPDAVVTCDVAGVLGEFNRVAREWHGIDPRGMSPEQWSVHFDLCRVDDDILLTMDEVPLFRALKGDHVRGAEIIIRAAGQKPRIVRCNAEPVRAADSTLLGAVCVFHDVTRLKAAEALLSEQALRDELTGLPNRAAWNAELTRAVSRAQRSGTPIAAMFLDLDDFKQINDTHGHAAGDHVLREFAAALRDTLRVEDLVARLAGDEFVLLLDRGTDIDDDPLKVAAKILERVARGTTFDGKHLPIRPSIGIGIQRGPNYDAIALMRRADEAMYAAKRARNRAPQVRVCEVTAGIVDGLE